MDHHHHQAPKPKTILETLGEEIVRIITPVSICMFLVVLLVSILNTDPSPTSISSMATVAYTENSSDSIWEKLKGAIFNSLVFIAVVTAVTFLLVLLFYLRCTNFLKYYMGFSSFLVLGFMGGEIAVVLLEYFALPIDCVTFGVLLFNFTVVGVLAVFMSKVAIFLTQAYLVVIGMLVAYWFTMLPEWTTWVLLVAMALYDLAAVLLPGGPLRLLVELAMARDEDIPALVYEARPVISDEVGSLGQRRVWRDGNLGENGVASSRSTLGAYVSVRSGESEGNVVDVEGGDLGESRGTGSRATLGEYVSVQSGESEGNMVDVEGGRVLREDSELAAPLIQHTSVRINSIGDASEENVALEGIGLGYTGAIKLGLGDFIFYSVLVGRAAMYDYMTVYACYLAIIAGLGVTLMLLAVYRKALPALPFSVMLGVLFYLLTRFLLEAFVVQCSTNLLMF